MADIDFRTDNICGQLQRYGSGVADDRLADILEELVRVNDDMWHLQHEDLIVAGLNRAIAASEALRDHFQARSTVVAMGLVDE